MSVPPHHTAYHSAWVRPQGRTVAACARQADEERRQRAAARPTAPQRAEVSQSPLAQWAQPHSWAAVATQSARAPFVSDLPVALALTPRRLCLVPPPRRRLTVIVTGALVIVRAAGVGRGDGLAAAAGRLFGVGCVRSTNGPDGVTERAPATVGGGRCGQ